MLYVGYGSFPVQEKMEMIKADGSIAGLARDIQSQLGHSLEISENIVLMAMRDVHLENVNGPLKYKSKANLTVRIDSFIDNELSKKESKGLLCKIPYKRN